MGENWFSICTNQLGSSEIYRVQYEIVYYLIKHLRFSLKYLKDQFFKDLYVSLLPMKNTHNIKSKFLE